MCKSQYKHYFFAEKHVYIQTSCKFFSARFESLDEFFKKILMLRPLSKVFFLVLSILLKEI